MLQSDELKEACMPAGVRSFEPVSGGRPASPSGVAILPSRGRGFTLVELLVVVTIIVVLLALLTPALDRAIYAAEMATDGANIKASITGIYTYAVEYKRRYPHRAYFDVPQGQNGVEMLKVNDNPLWDLRPLLRPYLSMKSLLDTFSGNIDYERLDSDSIIQCNYSLWFDYGMQGQSRFSRIGGRFVWRSGTEVERFSVLVSDFDLVVPEQTAVFNGHADDAGLMSFVVGENATEFGLPGPVAGPQGRKWSFSRWQEWGRDWRRGRVDQSYGYEDGSVRRYDGVLNGEPGVSEDERMTKVPPRPYAPGTAGYWSHLPRED
jgi:prepilin-type N-terminal cleavage/methylation domain-containing protein